MGRYIDADVLEKLFYRWANDKHTSLFDAFENALEECPDADVEEVVRCHECEHLCPESISVKRHCTLSGISTDDEDFCSYGKRRTE